jgi:hypothetical protein
LEFFSGDSGGGMILNVGGLSKMIGLVSASAAKIIIIDGKKEKICDLDNYVVYSDVSKFYNWINQVVFETLIR